MKKYYFDQAATSFPKPKLVYDSVLNYMQNVGVNINRGGYENSYTAEEAIYDVRYKLCQFFGSKHPENVVFTYNITYALNIVINGLAKTGDHFLISSMEHNAVYRPIYNLANKGIITFDTVKADNTGLFDISSLKSKIKKNTKALIVNHASNICSNVVDLYAISSICKEYGILLIVDTAQSAGHIPISIDDMGIDILCFTGHKGLFAPQGVGGFIIKDDIVPLVEPYILGGTGSVSESADMPNFMPDKFEAGTLNLPSIIGLGAGIDFINKIGLSNIYKKDNELYNCFVNGIQRIGGFSILALSARSLQVPVISINCDFMDEAELASTLDNNYHVMTRVGLHCAPLAHKAIGSYPRGSLRFSINYFNEKSEVDYVLSALEKIKTNK